MNAAFPPLSLSAYKNACQIARVVTERWAADNLYCPACPSDIVEKQSNNTEAVDFVCNDCEAPFQLKATKEVIKNKILDAGYEAMKRALASDTFPHLFVMQYDPLARRVENLLLIPRHFLSASAVEPRKPLGPSARRAGWVGCNIVLSQVPPDGRIPLIDSGSIVDSQIVRKRFKATRSMGGLSSIQRGWTLDVLAALRAMQASKYPSPGASRAHFVSDVFLRGSDYRQTESGPQEFNLSEAYSLEKHLSKLYPNNKHVRPKIRQQLQVLRDLGFLTFLGRGRYLLRPT